MRYNKIAVLLFSLIALTGLSWYTYYIIKSQNSSAGELIDFAIADTSSITKIRITDPYSNTIELHKKRNKWTDGSGACITQAYVHNILDVARNIEFKGYLSKNSHANYKNQMASYHTKVDFFVKNKWYKTWYIGPSAPDHYGQIMLLDSKKDGKSKEPVMMKVKGVNGIIEPNFFADVNKWVCTNIFSVPLEKIKSVEILNREDSTRSFKISQTRSAFSVTQNGKELAYADTANIYRYLQNYKKIHFDLANFVLSKEQCDSLKNTVPFCELILKETKGKKSHLKFYRIMTEEEQRNEYGEIVNMDMNKFWCELPDGTLVKCQYHVFNPLIFGHIYFPALEELYE